MYEIRSLKMLLDILGRKDRGLLLLIMLLMGASAGAELLGVGFIFLFIQLHIDPDAARDWGIVESLEALGISFSFLTGIGGAASLAVLFLVKNLFEFLSTAALVKFAFSRATLLGERLFAAYIQAPFATFIERNSAVMIRNLQNEIPQVLNGVMIPSIVIAANIILGASLLVFLLILNFKITLVAMVTVGGLGVISNLALRKLLARKGRQRLAAGRTLLVWIQRGIRGIRELRLGNREAFFFSGFARTLAISNKVQGDQRILSYAPPRIHESALFVGLIVVVMVAKSSEQDFTATVPVLGTFAFAGLKLMGVVNTTLVAANSVQFNAPSIEVLHRELSTYERFAATSSASIRERLEPPDTLAPEPMKDGIRLENVGFRYPNAELAAVRNLDLNIRPGTCVAIVGGSGAGKSTLIDLILGLIEPETGRILVDGEDIHKDINMWWRRLRSIPQHIYLLDATLAENVAFGVAMERIDRARVQEALKSAQLGDVMARLPEGIDQSIGENGVQLSGGERQRVGIARALYWDPEILVFDEATSALDTITERRITDWLKQRRAGQTLLIVAHRLSTVQHADVIHLMEEGRIVASGKFRELLAQNPKFEALVAAARHHDDDGEAVFIDKDM